MKKNSIQYKLFIQYAVLVLSIIILFSFLFYMYISNVLKKSISDSMLQTADSISNEIDVLFTDAYDLSNRLLFSTEIKDAVYSDFYNYSLNSLVKQRAFYSLCYAMVGPAIADYQINFIKKGGEFIGTGATTHMKIFPPEVIARLEWLNECSNNEGEKTIISTHYDPLRLTRQPILSLCRSFSRRWGQPKDSFVEIQLKYNNIYNIVQRKQQLADAPTQNIFIFDKTGKLVYPNSAEYDSAKKYLLVFNGSQTNVVSKKIDQKAITLVRFVSDYSGFQTIILQPDESLFVPLSNMRNLMILISLLALLLTLYITYKISQRLTQPIVMIQNSIDALTLETLGSGSMDFNSDINELERLNLTFQTMCIRLKNSVNEAVSIRSAEIHARMLALQSQMNPHFLYNTLATISVLAEDQCNDQIEKICGDLSDMMRYISSDSPNSVSIADELQHTKCYIELMKVRFDDDLIVEFSISQELMGILIPKLILQPVLENCAKYAAAHKLPCIIKVEGKVCNNTWLISVTDNGPGFSREAIEELQSRLQKASQFCKVPSLDGMGLVNIYMRLFLQYGANAIFKYGNRQDSGAYVVIGGTIN